MIGNVLFQRLADAKAALPAQRAAGLRVTEKSLWGEWFVRFAASFIMAGSNILGVISPFAVGFTSSAGSVSGCLASLAGATAGYLLSGSFAWAIKYICVAVIIFTATVVFRDTQLYKNAWFMPAAASFVMLCIGLVPAGKAGWTMSALAVLVADTALAGASAYFYKIALSSWSGRFNLDHTSEVIHTVSFLILISTLLLSLSQVTVFGAFSIGRAAATLVVFLAAYKGGVGMGCVAGVSIGLAMDAASTGAPIFCTAYGLAGLVSGIFSKQRRFAFAVSFILVDGVVAAVSIGNTGVPSILYEVFIASVVFMVLPPSLMARLSVLLPGKGTGFGVIKAREYTKKRVDETAQAFRELYDTVRSASGGIENDADVYAVFDKAADTVCQSCTDTSRCWHEGYQATVDAMNNATAAMLRRGSLEAGDLPSYFADSCVKLPELVDAVNTELRALLYRRQFKKRLKENQAAAFNQYADMAGILHGIAAELDSAGGGIEPELEIRLRKYLRSENIQAETAVFRDRSGRLHAEIFGASFSALKKDPRYLEKLSAVFNLRLCAVDDKSVSDRIVLMEAEPLAASVGISCKKRTDKEPSGDRGAYFKTDEGLLYVILSDGMGTGDQAARYAGSAVRILERFLRSGVAPETAVRMLNDLLLLKNEDDTICTTVDLVCINLFTGAARLFKYGAAPSYQRGTSGVRRIKGKSMAAGLGVPPNDAPDQLKMELRAGSLAVIVSDGVTAGLDDQWLCRAIADFDGTDPRELASSLVETASKKFSAEDDMTVIAIAVSERV